MKSQKVIFKQHVFSWFQVNFPTTFFIRLFFSQKKKLVNFKGRVRGRQRKNDLYLLAHSWNSHSWDWARLQPASQESGRISATAASVEATRTVTENQIQSSGTGTQTITTPWEAWFPSNSLICCTTMLATDLFFNILNNYCIK